MSRAFNYYDYFVSMMESAAEAAGYLKVTLEKFNVDRLEEVKVNMHRIEQGADSLQHEVMDHLLKEFLPPIDREDIIKLAYNLDEICDITEDVVLNLYMLGVKEIRPDALEVADILVNCCDELLELLKNLNKPRKADAMKKSIIEVNRLEEVADELFIRSMRKLYSEDLDFRTVRIWDDIYRCLENCCDACEHTADTVDEVLLKK